MDNLGYVPAGTTVHLKFTTNGSDGAPVAPSDAFEAADLRIYKGSSDTQRSSANGITMTSPFDSVTGLHHVSIDLSDDTDSGFYAETSPATDYFVVLIPDETVGGVAVTQVLARFKIGYTPVDVTHIGGATTNVAALATNVDAILTDTADMQPKLGTPADLNGGGATIKGMITDAYNYAAQNSNLISYFAMGTTPVPVNSSIDTTHVDLGAFPTYADDDLNGLLLVVSGDDEEAVYSRWIEGYVGATKVATVSALPFTPDTSDLVQVFAIRRDTSPTAGSIRSAVGLASANLDTQIADIEGKVDDLETRLGTPSDLGSGATVAANLVDIEAQTDDWNDGQRLDLLLDAVKAKTDNLPSDPADASVIAGRFDTLDTAVADLPTNSELSNALAAADDAVLAAIAALNNLSAAEVNAEVVDALAIDTYAEPTGVPPATATLAVKLGWLYMALRNRVDVTATKKTFYDDGGSAEWEKDLSDDGTTYSESEGNAI